ncbi:MAG: hypothetical protein H6Q14_2212 [Bacteroidetes bacterium]|nr:hypothetical protein [Bacteroidota bacterium]
MTHSRKISFCLAFVVFTSAILLSCKEQNENAFAIKGNIKNLKGNAIIFVRDYADSVVVDTIKADKSGDFSFEGVTDTLILGTLYFNNGASYTSLFVDKGSAVKVKGDANLPDLIEITGVDVNDDLTEFKKSNQSTLLARAKLLESIRTGITQKAQAPKPNPDLISKLSNLNYQLTNSASEYIKRNPEKIASVILLQDFFKDDDSADQMDKKLQNLKTPASKFSLTYQLRQYINQVKASQEGAIAPYFTVKDSKGNEMRGDQYRGKYLVLSFVSTNCPLCLKNREELQEIQKKYKGDQVNILSIIITEGPPPGNIGPRPSKDPKVDWKVVPLEEGWAAKILADYNINELPINILIDPKGKIIAREESPALIQPKLPKQLLIQ